MLAIPIDLREKCENTPPIRLCMFDARSQPSCVLGFCSELYPPAMRLNSGVEKMAVAVAGTSRRHPSESGC